MAKVAWSDVCRPLEEGGQGIRALHPLNKGLMCKHLWDVVQHNNESIWITWIYQYQLKRSTVCTANPNTGSWNWRKILRLRNKLIDHIRCTVGTGTTLTVWQDPWHPFGVLIHQFPRGLRVTGIPLEAQLSVVIQNGAWN
ncbi:UNVERIFIED_CONTAM: putative ribonuclease H protein [Sesamum latifolium]|uniref:Ribonuclease H protein n=1 Tax=Sesamum latifolium TaxID=2727402 RepID=A0AAW2WTD5_9LAMI